MFLSCCSLFSYLGTFQYLQENPFATGEVKTQLARETGLTQKQVSDYLGNWRKRKMKK